MRGFGVTDVGGLRRTNQDCFYISISEGNEDSIFVVCDGMGGAKSGEVASRMAADVFRDECMLLLSENELSPEEIVKTAVRFANSRVHDSSKSNEKHRGMGTTLVGGVFKNGRAALANVGDSRAYLINSGAIERVTKDHSLVEELVSRGELTPEQAREFPRKNVITRAVGVDPAVVCDVYNPEFIEGSRLLLCSDGLSNTITDGEFLGVSLASVDPETMCVELLRLALLRGAPDNVTAVVVEL